MIGAIDTPTLNAPYVQPDRHCVIGLHCLHRVDPTRENRVGLAQREGVETAISLAEVAGRHAPYADWSERPQPENAHKAGVQRAGLMMATGEVWSSGTSRIAPWATNTRDNGRSFFVQHCFLSDGEGSLNRLTGSTPLKVDIHQETVGWCVRPFHAFRCSDGQQQDRGKKSLRDCGDKISEAIGL